MLYRIANIETIVSFEDIGRKLTNTYNSYFIRKIYAVKLVFKSGNSKSYTKVKIFIFIIFKCSLLSHYNR